MAVEPLARASKPLPPTHSGTLVLDPRKTPKELSKAAKDWRQLRTCLDRRWSVDVLELWRERGDDGESVAARWLAHLQRGEKLNVQFILELKNRFVFSFFSN